MSFLEDKIQFEGLTFDDILLISSYPALLPCEVDLSSKFTRNMEEDIKKLGPEGITARVPFKGSLYEVHYLLLGELRAGMGYCGAKNIKSLQQAKFSRISNTGVQGSYLHDVKITREAPNYSSRQ